MWARIIGAALGAWLMAAPVVLGYSGAAEVSDRVVGPIVAASSFVAAWQPMRSLRWVELVAGAWLLVAPWVLGYEMAAMINSLAVGLVLAGLAFLGGKTGKSFGGGWRGLLVNDPGGRR